MTDRRQIDGCPEFDERLVELTADPHAPPEVEAHLATCERCRDALTGYRETGHAIAAAFTTLGGGATRAPRRPDLVTLAAAALLLVATALLLRVPTAAAPAEKQLASTLSVSSSYDAVVTLMGPGKARIENGTSTFDIRDGRSVVETPIGEVSCDDCEFTVQVQDCGAQSLPFDVAAVASLCVTISVARGQLGTTVLDQPMMMGPGQTVTWPMTAECVPVADARIPGLYQ